MGNTQTSSNVRGNRSNGTIEIIMADEQQENTQMISDRCDTEPCIYHAFSADSLLSVMSATSSTQTDPQLFTQWPKKRFLFKWMERFKNYHLLLCRSQQFLNSAMFINVKNEDFNAKVMIKSMSHSTQTVNQVTDSAFFFEMLSIKSSEKSHQQSLQCLSINNISKPLPSQKNESLRETDIKNDEMILDNNIVVGGSELEIEVASNRPLNKRPKLQPPLKFTKQESENSEILKKCSLLSQYNYKFDKSSVYKINDMCNSDDMMSSESLTSVTLISKHESSGLIYKANSTRKRNYKLRQSYNEYSNSKSMQLKNRKRRVKNKVPSSNASNKNFRKSYTTYKNTSMQQPLSVISSDQQNRNKSSSKLEEHEDFSIGKIQVLSYKFWIGANCKNWNVFHNPTDRRIESIGRIAKCKIQLTNTIARHSDGILKQQVIVYASDQSSLEKCCKLFDDKFPNFYATSGLIRILYFQSDSKLGTLIDNYRSMPHINIPLTSHMNSKVNQRKIIKKFRNDVQQFQFLSNELLSG